MRALFLLFFIALTQILSAQVVSGLYAGTLVNDSTKKEQRYELALSEYRGKITGYSYTTFVRNDSLFYSVKRVKATRKGGQLVVEDDKMIANNFPESPAKGVHQTNYIQLGNEDTLRSANGTWQTNRTKVYYVLTGGVAMQLDNDSTHSSLIGHLKELNIIAQPRYDTRDVAQTKQKAPEKPATVQPENNKQKEATAKSTPVKAAKGSKIKTEESKTKPDVAKSNPAIEQPVAEPASFNPSNKSRTESIGQTKATNQPTVATAPKLPVVATYRERKKN